MLDVPLLGSLCPYLPVYFPACRSTSSAGLCIGEEVEVQWKGRRSHPFGWWFATVQSVRGNRITLMFRYVHCNWAIVLNQAGLLHKCKIAQLVRAS